MTATFIHEKAVVEADAIGEGTRTVYAEFLKIVLGHSQ